MVIFFHLFVILNIHFDPFWSKLNLLAIYVDYSLFCPSWYFKKWALTLDLDFFEVFWSRSLLLFFFLWRPHCPAFTLIFFIQMFCRGRGECFSPPPSRRSSKYSIFRVEWHLFCYICKLECAFSISLCSHRFWDSPFLMIYGSAKA